MRPLLRFSDATGASTTSLGDLIVRGQARLDLDGLAAALSLDVPIPTSRTIYAGIRSDPHPDAWGPPAQRREPVRSIQEALIRMRSTLERTIERAIGDSRRVAVAAGGGIDSAVLLALTIEVAKRRGGSAFAVSIDFEGPGDDRPHMRALEARLGCEVIRVSPAAGAAQLPAIREGFDSAPAVWVLSPIQLALFKVARDNGADCFLSGAGGDHFFDGDPRAFVSMIPRYPLRAISGARTVEGFDYPRFPVLERIVRPLFVPYLPRSLRRFVAQRRREPPASVSWAGPKLLEIARPLWDRKLELALAGTERESASAYFEHPERRQYAWLVHQEKCVAGIARRDPYFTREIAEEVEALPPHMLLAGGRRRGLLREMMRGTLPDSLLDRPDKAEFTAAFRMFFHAAGGTRAFAEELEGRMLGRLGLVDRSAFKRHATRVLEGPEEDDRRLHAWAAVMTEAFLLRRPELL